MIPYIFPKHECFGKDRVARIVGVLLDFLTRKDVYVKGTQKYKADI